MKDNNNVFIAKIAEKIKAGDFDQYLTIPFMTRELLLISIKSKFERKLETGGTPILNDAEVKECVLQAIETAATTCAIFEKFGIVERTETGYQITKKGQIALKVRK